MAVILTVDDAPAIRAAIDTMLDSDSLPDSTIMMSIFVDRAERWMAAQIPDFASRTGAEAAQIKDSLILYTASLLVPTVAILRSETLPEYAYTRPDVDLDEKEAKLKDDAQETIDPIVTPIGTTPNMATHFTVASAYRGR
jgi:hypothetical protein